MEVIMEYYKYVFILLIICLVAGYSYIASQKPLFSIQMPIFGLELHIYIYEPIENQKIPPLIQEILNIVKGEKNASAK